MIDLLYFISRLLSLYIFVIVASAIFSWLYAVTEPVLRPIRRILPTTGGIDLSPVVLIIGIWFIQQVIIPNLARLFI